MDILLDEHVGRVFERVLREHGYDVHQAKDHLGERTTDLAILQWCSENDRVLVTNNARDFETLHQRESHAGIFVYRDQRLPDDDPEGLARAVREVVDQYGTDGVRDELVDLEDWYAHLRG